MIYKFVFSPEANMHLRKIFEYVANRDSELAAEKFVHKIRDYCLGFDLFPMRGTVRDDIRPGIRIVGFNRQASVAFTVDSDTVTIVGICYGSENFDAALPIGDP